MGETVAIMETKNKFVIITQPRSGSYYFNSLLDSAEDIVCHGEIFKKDRVEISAWHCKQLGFETNGVAQRDAMPFAFVNRLRGLNPKKIFGFKAFWPHLTPHKPLINKIILNPEWKKIFLVRNPLQTYASLQRARKTNKWVAINPPNGDKQHQERRVTVRFDPASFEKHLGEYRRLLDKNQEIITSQADSCFEIGYKAMLTQDKQGEILAFLGSAASPGQLASDYQKQYHGALIDAFENADELLAYLGQQGLMAMATTDKDIFDGAAR